MAFSLKEIRQDRSMTQVRLAETLTLTQPTISALESGPAERAALATVRTYIEGLGGTLEVQARFDDRTYPLAF